ncbi:MAG: ATP-binding protein, partial [Planctomycetota bacterium]
PLPADGERVLCLRNNPGKGLLNGTLWDVQKVTGKNEHLVHMEITPEEGGFAREVTAPAKFFHPLAEGDEQWPTNQSFRFGYAMTVHKAQGSEWKDVLVFDESGLWGKEAVNWLYTAITRASDRVTVIRG